MLLRVSKNTAYQNLAATLVQRAADLQGEAEALETICRRVNHDHHQHPKSGPDRDNAAPLKRTHKGALSRKTRRAAGRLIFWRMK